MLEIFVGKKVNITDAEGSIEYNLQCTDAEGTLIKIQDSKGKTRVINTASSNFAEIELSN